MPLPSLYVSAPICSLLSASYFMQWCFLTGIGSRKVLACAHQNLRVPWSPLFVILPLRLHSSVCSKLSSSRVSSQALLGSWSVGFAYPPTPPSGSFFPISPSAFRVSSILCVLQTDPGLGYGSPSVNRMATETIPGSCLY